MSQQYDNTNSGALFKNDRKQSERHPDYRGSVNVGGREYWLSAWIKEGRNGKFMSLSVQPKDQQGATEQRQRDYTQNYGPAGQTNQNSGSNDPADEIPF